MQDYKSLRAAVKAAMIWFKHTQTHVTDSCWPAILLAQPAQLKEEKQGMTACDSHFII